MPFCRSKMILDKSKLLFRPFQIDMDESKLFWTSPNCFGQVHIVSDKSKKFWTYPNGFRPDQNVLDIKVLKSCYWSSLIWTRTNCFGQEQNTFSIWSSSKNNFSLLNFIFEPLFWTSLTKFGLIQKWF